MEKKYTLDPLVQEFLTKHYSIPEEVPAEYSDMLSENGRLLSENNEVNGQTQDEIEYTFLAILSDDSQLSRAYKKEEYEQWSLMTDKKSDNANGGQIRVRSIDKKDFVFTIKMNSKKKMGGASAKKETEVKITPEFFEAFKSLANSGFIKTRYFFKIPNSDYEWECDVFYDESGKKISNWVQFDLEVKDKLTDIPAFPVNVTKVLDGRRTKDKENMDSLYDNQLLIKKKENILPIGE